MATLRLNQAWIDALKPHKPAYDVRDWVRTEAGAIHTASIFRWNNGEIWSGGTSRCCRQLPVFNDLLSSPTQLRLRQQPS